MNGLSDITVNLESSRNCLRRIARHDDQQFSKDSLVNVMEKFVKSVNYMDETILIPCRLMDRQVGDATDTVPQSTTTAKLSSSSAVQYAQHHELNRKDRQPAVHEFLNASDLFNLYNMLNSLKNDLLWSRNDDIDEDNTATNDDDEASSIGNATTTTSSSSSSLSSTFLNDQDVRSKCNEQQCNGSSAEQQQQHNKLVIVNNNNNNISHLRNTTTESTIKGHIRRPSTASVASSNSVSNLSDAESEISNENDSGIESEINCVDKGRKCSSSSSNCTSNGNIDKATELARQCRTHLSGLYRCLEQMTDAANYLIVRYQSDIGGPV